MRGKLSNVMSVPAYLVLPRRVHHPAARAAGQELRRHADQPELAGPQRGEQLAQRRVPALADLRGPGVVSGGAGAGAFGRCLSGHVGSITQNAKVYNGGRGKCHLTLYQYRDMIS